MREFLPLNRLLLGSRVPSHPVAFFKNTQVSWGELTQDVKALTFILKAHPAKVWALAFEDSYLFTVAFFALCHSEKSLVLPGNLQASALKERVHHCDGILHDAQIVVPKNQHTLTLPLNENTESPFEQDPLQAFNQIDLTLYTSGSSGEPKAIRKTLFQLQAELSQLESLWGGRLKETRIQSTVSHQHIYGLLFRVLWPLCAGRPFSRFDLVYLEQMNTNANQKTSLITSPALLKRLFEPASKAYCAVFSSGGPLPFLASKQTQACLGVTPIEVYGSTETGGIGFRTQTNPNTPWAFFKGIGARLDEKGCLVLLSPYIDVSKEYQTNDLCVLLSPFEFEIKGRADRVVKIEEKRVSLSEVELRLCQNPWILDAAAMPLITEKRHMITAVLILSDEGKKEHSRLGHGKFKLALRQSLKTWLEANAIPRKWRIVEEIPQNNQGKRKDKEIEALFTR